MPTFLQLAFAFFPFFLPLKKVLWSEWLYLLPQILTSNVMFLGEQLWEVRRMGPSWMGLVPLWKAPPWSSLAPSSRWAYKKRVLTGPCWYLDLGLPVSRTVRDTFLLFYKPPAVGGILGYSSLNRLRQKAVHQLLKPESLFCTPSTTLLSNYIMILRRLFSLTVPWLFHL